MKAKLAFLLLLGSALAGCGKQEPPPPPPPHPETIAAQKILTMIAAQDLFLIELTSKVMEPIQMARSTSLNDIEKVKAMQNAFSIALTTVTSLDEGTLFLDRELRHAVNTFEYAAKDFEARSLDYSDSSLRATCASWAKYYIELRDKCPGHRERLATFRQQIPRLRVQVRESGWLVDDLLKFLTTRPSEQVPEEILKRPADALRAYTKRFDEFEASIKLYQGGSK